MLHGNHLQTDDPIGPAATEESAQHPGGRVPPGPHANVGRRTFTCGAGAT